MRYAPTHLSYKKLQKETLCDVQLGSLIFLVVATRDKEEIRDLFIQIDAYLSWREVTFLWNKCESSFVTFVWLFCLTFVQSEVGCSVSKTVRSSLSTPGNVDGVPVGQRLVIIRFIKGVFNGERKNSSNT